MNLPTEVWWQHLIPKLDDATLLNLIESKIISINYELFWKKRIGENWVINTITPFEPKLEDYIQIMTKWDEFIKHIQEAEVKLTYVHKGSPCETPYHFSIDRNTPNILMRKEIKCGPSYINRKWMQQHELLEFNEMQDLLNWRVQTIEIRNPPFDALMKLRIRGRLGPE